MRFRYLFAAVATFLMLVTAFAFSLTIASAAPPAQSPQGGGPSIVIDKTVGTEGGSCATTDVITVTVGTRVYYCYSVRNSGGVTLARHDLEDSELGTILSDFPFTLVPGASAFITQTTIITQETVNTATWTAYNPGPTDLATDSDTATVFIGQPSIQLDKTVGTDGGLCAIDDELTVTEPTQVYYCYTVSNTGMFTVTRHDLEDSELGTILSDFPFTLVPGASAFITQTTFISATTVNTATWTAYNPGPVAIASSSDVATVTLQAPTAITIVDFTFIPQEEGWRRPLTMLGVALPLAGIAMWWRRQVRSRT